MHPKQLRAASMLYIVLAIFPIGVLIFIVQSTWPDIVNLLPFMWLPIHLAAVILASLVMALVCRVDRRRSRKSVVLLTLAEAVLALFTALSLHWLLGLLYLVPMFWLWGALRASSDTAAA